MKKIEENILGWFSLAENMWFSFGERYSKEDTSINNVRLHLYVVPSIFAVSVNPTHLYRILKPFTSKGYAYVINELLFENFRLSS